MRAFLRQYEHCHKSLIVFYERPRRILAVVRVGNNIGLGFSADCVDDEDDEDGDDNVPQYENAASIKLQYNS